MEPAPESHVVTKPKPPRQRAADAKAYGRTKISNGSAVIAGVRQSVGYVRRFKELLADYSEDMPQATTADRALIKRAAIIEIELERLETRFASAGAASQRNLDLYVRMTGNLRRVLQALGLQRHEPKKQTFGSSPLGQILREGIERQRESAPAMNQG
jgi:hypothetical protein